ncbi:MAG: ATP-binding protein [Bacteroidaceae bacterium]|nr:ATP-binding protein [Bacteroidaceae bacterium]
MLRRKITKILEDWCHRNGHKPMILSGARQVGKTISVREFAFANYKNVVEINFALQSQFKKIFDQGFDVDNIVKNITSIRPDAIFEPHQTLIFFDELQECPNCATSLKSFHLDGRYDVICSGSLMGIHYKEIDSNSVGFKEDVTMYALDFEEFLWGKGYGADFVDSLLASMLNVESLSTTVMDVLDVLFKEYMLVGGMPEVTYKFVQQNTFNGILELQRQLLKDYEDDITKYAKGIDKAKIKAVYRHLPVFLAKENKKFQISKVATGARSREYVGVNEWLEDAKIVNICYCLDQPELPLGGNYAPNNYKMYYHDIGLLVAALDKEAQMDLYENKNFNTYKGAIYENVVANALVRQGYDLYFYRNEKSTLEMDFFVRDMHSLIPVEVKAKDGATLTLNKLIDSEKFEDIKYGIKFGNKNIGFNGKFYTFPYALTFLLSRYLEKRNK